MIAFSFGFIAQQVGAEPPALRKLSSWGTDYGFLHMPLDSWEESQCIGGRAHYIGSSETFTGCDQMCRNTPNAKACQYEDTYDYYNCYAFFGDDVKNCYGLPVDWNDDDDEMPCDNYSDLGLWCKVFTTSIPARPASTCTGKDFRQKIQDWKLESPGIKLFGCGKNKIKSECALGCERDYKVKDGSGVDKGEKGIKSTYVAECKDGVVMGQYSPDMSEKDHSVPKPMIPICRKWFPKSLWR